MAIKTGERAAGDVTHNVAASALGRKPNLSKRVDDLRQRLDCEPVQLDVLPRRNVGDTTSILRGDVGDDVELMRRQQAIRKADAHHEVLAGLTLAGGAAGYAEAIAL